MDFLGLGSIRKRLAAIEGASHTHGDDSATAGRLDAVEESERLGAARINELEETIDQLLTFTGELEQGNKTLTLAVSEGIEKTNRAERRVRATVQRARKELAELGLEDPKIEGEAAEIRERDEDGSEIDRLHPVPEEVGGDPQTPSSIKGVSKELIRRVRGI